MHVDRRQFLRRSIAAALGGASVYSALGNLRLVAAAAARPRAVLGDYRALVCVFLYGGNDSFNTVVPTGGAMQADYVRSRGELALTSGLHALVPAAGGGPAGYGLHPAMPELAALFNSGQAAIIANVGTLLYPISQAEFQAGTVPSPPQLFSHDDQSTQWQTSRPDDANANGWGGRMADLLYTANAGAIPMSITLSGSNRFQRGAIVNPYAMDPYGVTRLSYSDDGPESWVLAGDNSAGAAAWEALVEPGTQAHVLERAYAEAASRSVANYRLIDAALGTPPEWSVPFPDTDLGNQLRMVAELVAVRGTLGMSRQVFFVSSGAWDTHSEQLADQQANLQELSQALAAFHAATVQLGIADSVTAFTASDFGRSLAVNGNGTDHGWGGHHFVLGGGVRGQRFYGTLPSLAPYEDGNPASNPDDTGYGQLIPTLAVDQYAATLARWLGVDAGGIADIYPNLGRFELADLGFMA